MRLRNIPGADEVIASDPYCIKEPNLQKGYWNKLFQNGHPIQIEIGMGKGQFLMQLARENSEINYIGIERYSSVLLRAIQKMESPESPSLKNIRFLCVDAMTLPEIFEKEEIDKIYLNFSDPWPKDRHAKRRLTSRQFFARYNQILKQEGTLEFKTDNHDLFLFSLEEIRESGWNLKACTFDLHHDTIMNQGNIMTEYEEKFSALGNPIHKFIASPKTL
ncbi:MAG: tRNA (guanosine(46)-N7)-methyltransferase TrmB [Lachnospiraceae bacterium]|nr:tRNA (guanosine(46)-N7)-methyltransferase TrmB [Lachnospiraceae bacterium]